MNNPESSLPRPNADRTFVAPEKAAVFTKPNEMKRVIFACWLTLQFSAAYSQLYVNGNSYLYSVDRVVTVTQNLSMASSSALYLRGSSQLLQKTTGTSANSGAGIVSVFQEGSSNEFKYNYWCSPVGGTTGTGNAAFGITQLSRPTGVISSTAATILPATGGNLNGVSNPLSIAQYWVYKFQSGLNYSEWSFVGSASTLLAGEGFTMKGTSGTDATAVLGVSNNPGSAQRYDFRGRANDGTISVSVGATKFTLTGNPYPSALDLSAFLLDSGNTAIDGSAYFWEQSVTPNSHFLNQYVGGYGTFVPVSLASTGVYTPATFATYNGDGTVNNPSVGTGTATPRRYAPIGQGFMVKGTANGTVSIKNSHRIYVTESVANNSVFSRLAAPFGDPIHQGGGQAPALTTPTQIRLNIALGNGFSRQAVLILEHTATEGLDHGMEAENGDEFTTDAGFFLDGKNYVIDAVSYVPQRVVPMIVKTEEPRTIGFYLAETVEFPNDMPVYIHDALDDSYHNLREGAYLVDMQQGVDTTRFTVRFQNQNALGVNDGSLATLGVFQDNNAHQLVIENPALESIDAIRVFDIAGREVMTYQLPDPAAQLRYPTARLATGAYIVKIDRQGRKPITKKILVK